MHCMIDLETMGISNKAAIMSIGAVLFDSEGLHREFYVRVKLQSSIDAGLVVDGSTVEWWLGQDKEAQQELLGESKHLAAALLALADFIGYDNDNLSVWGNGATFDNVILENAFNLCHIIKPWKYYQDRCFRTMRKFLPYVEIEDEDIIHKAIADARWQARYLIKAAETGGVEL